MTTRFTIVPAAYVLLLRDGAAGSSQPEVLLQLRQNTGYRDGFWAAAAAGHIEFGETAPVAAAREAAEELGITEVGLSFATSMQRTNGPEPIEQRLDVFFTAQTWSGQPRIMEPLKCAELAWAPLDALPRNVVPHERFVLEHLAAGTLPPLCAFGF